MKLYKLSWKNIWRNRIRSGVILGAIATGLFAGTFLSAFMTGWIVGTINDDINTHMSHVQIHDTAFFANGDINAYFMKSAVAGKIRQAGVDAKVSCRLKLSGMLASASNAVGISAKGVFADEEKAVSVIGGRMADSMGVFLPEEARMPVVISKKTAEKLKVRLKSKIVFTFQDVHGEMQSVAFRVSGIYKTTNRTFDEGTVFVRYGDIFAYTGLPEDAVHEAGIKLKDLAACEIVAPRLKELFPGLGVRDWGEINPALAMSMAWSDLSGMIITAIFLLALSFGIINTMLMAILERTRELGMLGAIGMSKRRIFSMVMLETIFLTLLGSVAGMVLGALLIIPSTGSGIDLSFFMEDQFEDYGFSSVVYPVLNVGMFLQISLLVVVAGILSAIYPAAKALKLKPKPITDN
ncbi:MAG: FtsX-like permease family protein [Tannerella sp.]|jgi:ABC-type lipoprotein release transport system permease subunit|nr:FtsX-like permease family protein [Tannerella sp.]